MALSKVAGSRSPSYLARESKFEFKCTSKFIAAQIHPGLGKCSLFELLVSSTF